MEEFVEISGDIIEMHIAVDITGLTEEELRKCSGYMLIDTTPKEIEMPDEYYL